MSGEELYEITRGNWRIKPERWPAQPRYAIGIAQMIVVSVFEIESWTEDKSGRVSFIGKPAPELEHYLGKSVRLQKGGKKSEVLRINLLAITSDPNPENR